MLQYLGMESFTKEEEFHYYGVFMAYLSYRLVEHIAPTPILPAKPFYVTSHPTHYPGKQRKYVRVFEQAVPELERSSRGTT